MLTPIVDAVYPLYYCALSLHAVYLYDSRCSVVVRARSGTYGDGIRGPWSSNTG